MLALTPCWYNRQHLPEGHRHRTSDGGWSSRCRYCERAIRRQGKGGWKLADGFDPTEISGAHTARYFYLFDPADDFIVARFALADCADEAAIDAYKAEISTRYGLDEEGNILELRDSSVCS